METPFKETEVKIKGQAYWVRTWEFGDGYETLCYDGEGDSDQIPLMSKDEITADAVHRETVEDYTAELVKLAKEA